MHKNVGTLSPGGITGQADTLQAMHMHIRMHPRSCPGPLGKQPAPTTTTTATTATHTHSPDATQ